MASENLRKRIEALNKKPLKNVPDPGREEPPEIKGLRRKLQKQAPRSTDTSSAANPKDQAACSDGPGAGAARTLAYSRSGPLVSRSPQPAMSSRTRDFGPPVSLEEAVSGVLTQAPCGPGYYLIEQPAHAVEPAAVKSYANFFSLTGHPDGDAAERIAAICSASRIAPEQVLFVDLETTGLSMTPVFLIGTMECREGGFHFKQYFARDYSEEISILAAFSQRLKNAGMIVTFNGKSFDVPYLRNRAVATGVKLARARSHLDLLHEARRVFGRRLPNCRLQTLEQLVCGRSREDDIPGHEIPEAYHEFVRTGNANRIGLILQHNLYDLLTMADLMHCMWRRD